MPKSDVKKKTRKPSSDIGLMAGIDIAIDSSLTNIRIELGSGFLTMSAGFKSYHITVSEAHGCKVVCISRLCYMIVNLHGFKVTM